VRGDGDDGGVLEDELGGFLEVGGGEGFGFFDFFFAVVDAEVEEFVKGVALGHGAVGLVLHGFAGEEGGFDGIEGVFVNEFSGEFGDFFFHFGAGEFDLVRGGAEVEGEVAGLFIAT